MRKRTISIGSVIVSIIVCIIYFSLGVVSLLWGAWVILSDQGTRPAMLEYFAMAFGAFMITVGIVVVVRQVACLVSEETTEKANELVEETERVSNPSAQQAFKSL